ncbi:hypothetical protein VYU27_003465 [Nannochloropsis oceanica]
MMMMSGHSKWSKIKRAKGSNDAKRAILFTKLAVELTEASRQAKGDTSDIRLAAAISKAKANNVPKDNIEGAIKRGVEGKGSTNMEAVTYEGIGPGSTAIIIEALTDNRKRTAPNVRHAFSKNGGTLGSSGSVAWMFVRRGLVEIPEEGREKGRGEEALLDDALEAGAEDVEGDPEEEWEEGEDEPRVTRVYCEPGALAGVRKGLEERGWRPSLVQFAYVPTTWVEVEVEEEEGKEREKGKVAVVSPGQQLLTLLEALEEDPDVQNVFHNARLI